MSASPYFFIRKFATLAVLIFLGAEARSQIPEIKAVRCPQPPRLTGNQQDALWLSAGAATGFTEIFSNKPPEDGTTCRLLYDDEAIYVLFVCHDSKPEQIVGREITPEAEFKGEDTVTLTIDPYHTRNGSSVSKFTVNVLNTRSESIAGGHSSKAEWRGIWDSRSKRTKDGYVVEMRIPWRILNYPKSAKPIDMDINFERYQARTKTTSQWANVTPSYKPELIGVLKGVQPPSQDSRSRWQFLAYDAPGLLDGKLANRAGLDARYAVTNQQSALFSINPDFVNIEQQIAGVDFVHTERQLNDARPFFTEGGNYFNPIGMFEYGVPFYSQRIGAINFGSKFYGQLSPTAQLGTLAVNQSDGSVASFTNYTENIGTTYSQAIYASTYNLGAAHDDLVGGTLNKKWSNWFAHSAFAVEDNGHSKETAGNLAFGYGGAKWFTEIQQIWVDPSFNPILAYVPWQDRRGAYTYTNFNDNLPNGPFHDWNFFIYTPDFYQADGTIQERGIQAGVNFNTRNDQAISLNRNLTDYQTGTDNNYDIAYTFNASNRFKQFGVEYLFGTQNSTPSRYVNVKGSLRVFHRIDLSLTHSVLAFSDDAQQTIATVGWQIDNKRSLAARLVETNGQRNFFLSYQSSGWTGAETYVIIGDPNSVTFSRRVSLKFVWAF